jgi:hypothetical protein
VRTREGTSLYDARGHYLGQDNPITTMIEQWERPTMSREKILELWRASLIAIAPETSRHERLIWTAEQVAAQSGISIARAYFAVERAIS